MPQKFVSCTMENIFHNVLKVRVQCLEWKYNNYCTRRRQNYFSPSGIDLSHQMMTCNKTEEIRFKNDRCSQPDQIENISRQKSVSQEMAHIVYQLVVLMSSPPQEIHWWDHTSWAWLIIWYTANNSTMEWNKYFQHSGMKYKVETSCILPIHFLTNM
jgi:hypothetical protein